MYTLLVDEDNNIVTTTRETIMQRSTNFSNIQILIRNPFKGIDISDATIWMRYILPVSKKIKMMQLILNDAAYKENYLQYILPANTLITSEAGNVMLTLTIIKLVYDEEASTNIAGVEKTSEGSITITPVVQWADFDPDELLNGVDQRLIMLEARQKDQDALNQEIFEGMVNDVKLDTETNKINLVNNKGIVGSGVDVNNLTEIIANAIVGTDADGIQDGVTHLDDVLANNNMKFVNLDNLIK